MPTSDAVPGASPACFHAAVPIIENVPLAERTHRLRFAAPALASAIRPGQFFMVRLSRTTNPLLGRPFALYDTVLDHSGEPSAVDFVYLEMGKLTSRLPLLRPGDEIEVWGPLGNTFPELSGIKDVALVAGGIGQTPFLACTRELLGDRGYGGRGKRRQVDEVRLYYGVRTAALAACMDDFRQANARVHLATDDGSLGFRGLVTDLLQSHGRPGHIIGCGPEPMLLALVEMARRWQVPCHVSLETPMACGIGVCFSCVTKIETGAGWDYRRVCIDGPVFGSDQWPAGESVP